MAPATQSRPTAILILAVVQGFVLYALHRALTGEVWPATQPAVLIPLYLLAIFLPLTAQLLSRFLREHVLWNCLGVLAVLLVIFGVHFALNVLPERKLTSGTSDLIFPSLLPIIVLWLVLVAFLRARLECGSWRPEYRVLFAAAWRNKLTLLEAFVFTGLLWLLLLLWGQLFQTLKIGFFRELFALTLFIYPVTAITLGLALHLIGSIDRFVDVVLGQVLSLLKWLLPVAGLIVVLFTFALLPQLPALFAEDLRPISAAWMLWLVAITMLLLNAAYQDGAADRPYGAAGLSTALRLVPPLMAVIALTSLYALYVRIDAFGLTVSRYWGLLVAVIAVAHSMFYAIAAVKRGPWMRGISQANPLLAALLCTLIILSLTPLLSPYRLSTASQQRIALAPKDEEQRRSALQYMRFSSGEYGNAAVQAFAKRSGSVENDALAQAARDVLGEITRWDPRRDVPPAPADWLAGVRIYPKDTPLPRELERVVRNAERRAAYLSDANDNIGLWIDMTEDAGLEFLLMHGASEYEVYALQASGWKRISRGGLNFGSFDNNARDQALEKGDFGARAPALPDVRIGETQLRLVPHVPPTPGNAAALSDPDTP